MLEAIISNIITIILVGIGSTVLVIARNYADKITKSIVARNEAEALQYIGKIRNDLIENVDKVVEAAIASTMQLADDLKDENGKLSEEDSKSLNEMANKLIYDSLPDNLTEENGTLSKIMGGEAALQTLIDGMIEKHITVEKAERSSIKANNRLAARKITF